MHSQIIVLSMLRYQLIVVLGQVITAIHYTDDHSRHENMHGENKSRARSKHKIL